MQRTRITLSTSLLALGLALATGAATGRAAGAPEPARVAPALLAPDGGGRGPARDRETVSLYLRLRGASLSQEIAAAPGGEGPLARPPLDGAALSRQRERIAARQLPTRRAVEATGAVVVASFQTTTNGFLVHARRAQIPALARVPGVESIQAAPLLTPDLAELVPWIGADQVWQDAGFDGTGTTVAVLDTGTDYTHAAFGGPGTVAAYEANDPTIVEPGTFPTARVIGGYDFAGETYAPGCPPGNPACTGTPEPDDDPLDANGHGTHVSGIVAGQAVESGGLAKGVAPGAKLVALKVFGVGSTDLAMSAVEWVTNVNLGVEVDGTAPPGKIDVINMSLGSDFGPDAAIDNEVIDAAIAAGVTVVASAGNDANVPFITGSPAASDSALSVASGMDPGDSWPFLVAEWTAGGNPMSAKPGGPPAGDWLPSLEEAGQVTAPMAWAGTMCNGVAPEQDLREKMALIIRGGCAFYDKITNAQNAGAVAAVVFNNVPGGAISMGCGAPSPCDVAPDITAIMIDLADGETLRDLLVDGTVVTGTLDPDNVTDMSDIISGFSSRGPARTNYRIKPQITAPGNTVFSAAAGTGDEGVTFGGTSMSGPAVAGVAALLAQRNKAQTLGLEPLDISALAMNYSEQTIELSRSQAMPEGPAVGVSRQGAGRVNALAAAQGDTLVRSEDGIAELSFGFEPATNTQVRVVRTLTVRNLGAAEKRYSFASKFVFADDSNQGVGIQVEPASLTVPAGQSAEATVTAVITPARLREWDMRSYELLLDVDKLQRLEVDGFVSITEVDGGGAPVTGGDRVSVPFYVLPRKQSCLNPTDLAPFHLAAEGDSVAQTWTNPCPQAAPMQPIPWLGADPAESAADPAWPGKIDLTDLGALYFPVDEADPGGEQILVFGLATAGATHIPYDSQFRVYLDYDRDGKYDEVIYNLLGQLFTDDPAAANRFVVGHTTLMPDGITPDIGATTGRLLFQVFDVQDQVAFLAVYASELDGGNLDLAAGRARFGAAASVGDLPEDFPVTGSFLGFDLAPDGAFDEKPEMYGYDQAVMDCLHLVDSEGTDTGRLGPLSFTVPANVTKLEPVTLKAACQPPAEGVDIGAMYVNIGNPQGEGGEEDQGYHVRFGRLGRAATSPIYLPYLAKGHAFMPEANVVLSPVGEGGTAGAATLTQKGNRLAVRLSLPAASTDTPHPAHIHVGSCANPGEVYKPLADVVDGMSATTLDGVSLGMVSDGNHYLNVHRSAEDMATSISCGDIPPGALVTP